MPKVYLINYSQLVNSNMLLSAQAFATASKRPLGEIATLAQQQMANPNSTINQFKTGKISEAEFIAGLNSDLNMQLNPLEFKDCWNAMCTITADTVDNVRELQQLQQQTDFKLHVMGNTNSLHVEFISQQLTDQGIVLEFTHTFSHEVNLLNPPAPTTENEQFADCEIIDLRASSNILNEIKSSATVRPKLSM